MFFICVDSSFECLHDSSVVADVGLHCSFHSLMHHKFYS